MVSWGYEAETPGESRFVDLFERTGTRDIASFLSVPAAIEFQQEYDWMNIREVCHDLVREAQKRICAIFGLLPLSDASWFMQFCSVPLPKSTNLVSTKTRLYKDYGIEIPLIQWNDMKLIRISVQGYNTQRDVYKLIGALEKIT